MAFPLAADAHSLKGVWLDEHRSLGRGHLYHPYISLIGAEVIVLDHGDVFVPSPSNQHPHPFTVVYGCFSGANYDRGGEVGFSHGRFHLLIVDG